MARKVIVAAWSVLSILGVAQKSLATESFFPQVVILSGKDSAALYNRISQPAALENYRGLIVYTKRFASSDGAIRIDCAQTYATSTISCAVSLSTEKSVTGVSKVQQGVVQNSMVFEFNDRNDIKTLLTHYVAAGPITTSEMVKARYRDGTLTNLYRFTLECPKDWVFDDVVNCQGYVILR